MIGHRGLVVRDARRYRAPHHEGLTDPHPEERPLGRVSKDEATELENALSKLLQSTIQQFQPVLAPKYLAGG